MPTLLSNGIHLYYEIEGEGDPLLLIGGLSNDVTDYKRSKIVAFFAQRLKTIAFDNRGVGRSDKPDERYSIEMMAEDAVGLLRGLEIPRAHILGVSLGGRIAMEIALRYPQMVNKLVLVSTGPKVIDSWRRHVLFALASLTIFKGKYAQPYYAFKRQEAASSSYDCTERLGEIKAPTLIVHGKHDGVAPYALAEEMHRRIGGSKMISFNGGHTFLFFHAQRFVDAVAQFLTGES